VKDEISTTRSGRVIRLDCPEQLESTRAERVVVVTIAGRNDAASDDEPEIPMGAEIVELGAGLIRDPALARDVDLELRGHV
jgi:hypothetical protein